MQQVSGRHVYLPRAFQEFATKLNAESVITYIPGTADGGGGGHDLTFPILEPLFLKPLYSYVSPSLLKDSS